MKRTLFEEENNLQSGGDDVDAEQSMPGSEVAQWAGATPELGLCRLEHLERDGVHVQCLDSTDFVIGRQTNFNGPVTIITCADVLKREKFFEQAGGCAEEGAVIQENIVSKSAAARIKKMAMSQDTLEKDGLQRSNTRRRKTVFFIFLGFLGASAIASAASFTTTPEEPATRRKCTPLTTSVCLYSEFDWGGRPNSSDVRSLEPPIPYVVISQTDDYEGYCYTYDGCLDCLRFLQHQRTPDAACNFLLGGEGNVYEDRGWRLQTAPRCPLPRPALTVCFMGDFRNDYPTHPQVQAASALIHYGVKFGLVARDYVLLPGNASYQIHQIIRKWPSYRECLF